MFDTYEIETEKKQKFSKNKIFIILGIICFFVFLIIIFNTEKEISIQEYLEDSSKDVVYQKSDDVRIPYLNLNNSLGKEINEEIEMIYEDYIITGGKNLEYSYNRSKNKLSIMIKYNYQYRESEYPTTSIDSFVLDLKTMKKMSNDEVLSYYDLKKKHVSFFLENKFSNFYRDALDKNFYTKEECDYDCFVINHSISDDVLEDVTYYIEDDTLYLYKVYEVYSELDDEEIFGSNPYRFEVISG